VADQSKGKYYYDKRDEIQQMHDALQELIEMGRERDYEDYIDKNGKRRKKKVPKYDFLPECEEDWFKDGPVKLSFSKSTWRNIKIMIKALREVIPSLY